MSRKHPKRRRNPSAKPMSPPGSSPGTLIKLPYDDSQLTLMGYGLSGYTEAALQSVEEIPSYLEAWPVVWIDVNGLGNLKLIESLGEMFNLHRLALEDCMNVNQRSKVENYDDYLFMIVKMGMLTDQFETEQIGIFIKNNVVITFQEKNGDSFEILRGRIRTGAGKIWYCGTDYLGYALLDAVIDGYFPILEQLGVHLTSLESDIITETNRDVIQKIYHLKSDLLFLHRTIWPIRDVAATLTRGDFPIISANTRTYLRDCHDHSLQLSELTEFYRDMASGLMNTFLAFSGNRMNEIMKVLTMISAIFIPLSFIAGVYGMNFDTSISPYNMPELKWALGYPIALGMMLIVVVGMLIMFYRQGWIGKKHDPHS